MKPNIHPNYHEITVAHPDGTTFKTRSTYGKEGDKLQLDISWKTHPAWTGAGTQLNERSDNIAKFRSRFGNLGLGGKAESADANADSSKKDDKKN